MSKLTLRNRIFIDEYMRLRNATEAAKSAGYKEKTAKQQGQRLLTNVDIQNEIKRRELILQQKSDISVQKILDEEKVVAFFDPAEIFSDEGTLIAPKQLPPDVRRNIASIEITEKFDQNGNKYYVYKYKFWDKGRALERLERHLGMYNDSILIRFDEGVQVILDVLPDDIREAVTARIITMRQAKK